MGIFIVFNGSFLSGVWLVFIGWFLNGAAAANRRQVTREEALQEIPVSGLMRANPNVVRPDETIDRVVLTMLLHDGVRALPVMLGGRVIGIIAIDDVRHVPQHAWSQQTVFGLMTSSPLITVAPDDSILHAMDLFEEHAVKHALVMDGADVAGMLSRHELARFLELSRELGVEATLGRRKSEEKPLRNPLPARRAAAPFCAGRPKPGSAPFFLIAHTLGIPGTILSLTAVKRRCSLRNGLPLLRMHVNVYVRK